MGRAEGGAPCDAARRGRLQPRRGRRRRGGASSCRRRRPRSDAMRASGLLERYPRARPAASRASASGAARCALDAVLARRRPGRDLPAADDAIRRRRAGCAPASVRARARVAAGALLAAVGGDRCRACAGLRRRAACRRGTRARPWRWCCAMRMPLSSVVSCALARLQLSARSAASCSCSALFFAAGLGLGLLALGLELGIGGAAARLRGRRRGARRRRGPAAAAATWRDVRRSDALGRARMSWSAVPAGGGRSLYWTWPLLSRHFHCASAGRARTGSPRERRAGRRTVGPCRSVKHGT